MLENNKYKISVITAVYNAELCIQNLIESLRVQKDKDFEWVVVDGASTDRTLEILKSISDLNIRIISEPDFGIYDALNKGIKKCSGEFYLVVGSDDLLYDNCIRDFKANISADVDILTAHVNTPSGFIMKSKRGPAWLSRMAHYISCHSVGAVFRADLHNKYGYYTNRFPICADQYFVQKSCINNLNIKHLDFKSGYFNNEGVSSVDKVGALTEDYRIMLELGYNKYVQTFFFLWRLMKRLLF